MAEHLLRGLDGANPLAFLAALGTFRVLTLINAPDSESPRMAWRIDNGAWRPSLTCSSLDDERALSAVVDRACRQSSSERLLPGADNLNVSTEAYRAYALHALHAVIQGETIYAEFAAALACEATVNDDGSVQDTALRTMSGAGHQHFLKTMRNLIQITDSDHIHKALFLPWQFDDALRNMSLRWDPSEDNRYALRWSDPSGDQDRQVRGAMWGANRLAIEALPMLPVVPAWKQLETTGFRTAGSRNTYLTWPIWETPIDVESLRSLLALSDLQHDQPDRRALRARGVMEVFRSQRLTVGKFRNFTWGIPT